MILDLLINLSIVLVRGVLALLPDMQAFPESFNTAWIFMANSIAGLVFIFAPEVGDIMLWTMQSVVVIVLLLFVWWVFTTIWYLIRG